MNDIIDDFEQSAIPLSEKDIFIKIWTEPRRVFKFIHDSQYEKHVSLLLVLGGISCTLDRASMKGLGDSISLLPLLGICIGLGALFGWLSYYIYASLIRWTGTWLKGEGDTASILRVLAYALIPTVVGLVFLVPQIGVYGIEIFKSDGDITSSGIASNIVVYGAMILELILATISLVFMTIGVAEVQKLSLGKAFVNLILPAVVIIGPILILTLIFSGL